MKKKPYEDDEVYKMALEAQQPQTPAAPTAPTVPTEKPVYKGGYDQQLNDVFEQIKNRKPFEFHLNGDALYDDIQQRAVQQGKLAMRDTMGRAAALTGGYGSSFGQRVGQQAYDANLQQSLDVIPELYNMALGRYEAEGQGLRDQYGMLDDMAGKEYGQYRDQMRDWEYQQELQRQQDQLEYERSRYEEEKAYQRQQAEYKKLLTLISGTGYNPSDEELAAAGMNRQQADLLRAPFVSKPSTGGGGSYGGGGGYGGGGNPQSMSFDQMYQHLVNDSNVSITEINDWLMHQPEFNAMSPDKGRDYLLDGHRKPVSDTAPYKPSPKPSPKPSKNPPPPKGRAPAARPHGGKNYGKFHKR